MPTVPPNCYRCDCCGGVFGKPDTWSDEQAIAESVAMFGTQPAEDLAIVCDDCFNDMQVLFNGPPH